MANTMNVTSSFQANNNTVFAGTTAYTGDNLQTVDLMTPLAAGATGTAIPIQGTIDNAKIVSFGLYSSNGAVITFTLSTGTKEVTLTAGKAQVLYAADFAYDIVSAVADNASATLTSTVHFDILTDL